MKRAIVPLIATATFLGGACSSPEQSAPSSIEVASTNVFETDMPAPIDTTTTTSLPLVEVTTTEQTPSATTTTEPIAEPLQYSTKEYIESDSRNESLSSFVNSEATRAMNACENNENVTCFWFDGGNGTVTTGPIEDFPEAVSNSTLTISALQPDGSFLYMDIQGIVDDPVNPTYAGFKPSGIRVYNVGKNQDKTSTASIFRIAKSHPFNTTYEMQDTAVNSASRIGGSVSWLSEDMNNASNYKVDPDNAVSGDAVEGSVAVNEIDSKTLYIISGYVNALLTSS